MGHSQVLEEDGSLKVGAEAEKLQFDLQKALSIGASGPGGLQCNFSRKIDELDLP